MLNGGSTQRNANRETDREHDGEQDDASPELPSPLRLLNRGLVKPLTQVKTRVISKTVIAPETNMI
jgi:hypothetical protein